MAFSSGEIGKQECIPVGCVPSGAVAVSAPGGVPAPRGVPGPGGVGACSGGWLVRGVPATGGGGGGGGIPACTEADPPP